MDKLVCLDPGHAYKTPGKRSFDGSLREYEFNRDVAKRTRIYLEKSGIHVIYSLDLDNPVDKKLEDRCALANIANADLFVSIHANAFGIDWNSANGWEIYYYPGATTGKRLAESIRNASIPELGLKDRGIKTSKFTVLKNTKMPAVLIEHGFYTNKEECEKLKSDSFREKCAIANAKGICNYLGVTFKK